MRTWLITGGTSGFGQAYAEEALAQGDHVVLTARKAERLDEWVKIHGRQALVRYRDHRPVGVGGIGLALVQGLVVRMGGKLEVSRAPEGGACFRAVLPPAR